MYLRSGYAFSVSNTTIQFKGEWFVRLLLDKRLNSPPGFNVGGPHEIEITVAPIEDENSQAENPDAVRCLATGRWSIDENLRTAFDHLSRGMLPDGRDPGPAWEAFLAAFLTKKIEPGATRIYSIEDLYPDHVRTFVRSAQSELQNVALRIIGLVRWRMDARGGHNPIRQERGLWFSLDGTVFFPVLVPFAPFHGWSETHARIEPAIHAQIVQYAQGDDTQPVGHVLLREAFTTRAENPRSALIVAVAALEVGVKEYIAARAPAAEWLVFNAPSPPVVTLLTDYLPRLPAASGACRSPPDTIIKTLKKAVLLRNSVAHKGEANISQASLVEIMTTIRDVLRVLDYYRGYEWSRAYVTEKVAKDWLDGAP